MPVLRFLAILSHLALSAAGSVLGFPIVGWLALTHAWGRGKSALGKDIWVWTLRVAWPWGNEEDGIDPSSVPTPWGAFVWSAWRNKVSNLRFTPPLGFRIDPTRVRFHANDKNLYLVHPDSRTWLYSYTWHGVYSGLWVVHVPSKRQLRLGWTLVPDDAIDAYDPRNLRQMWCGFSFQFLNKWS